MPVLALLLQIVFHTCNLHARHASQHASCSSYSDHGTQDFVERRRTLVICATLNMHTAQITGSRCIMCTHVTPERAASGLQGCQTG